MASFTISFAKTSVDEGGYSFDPDDYGSETYCAISRTFNPDWRGWLIIDALKQSAIFPHNLELNTDLKVAVRELLKEKYWDTFCGDSIPDQGLANNLYDISVNIGSATAVQWLQCALTVLNRNDPVMFYSDLKIDGEFGPKTMSALLKFAEVESHNVNGVCENPYTLLSWVLNDDQSCHYRHRQLFYPEQRKYTRGHLKRTRSDEV